MKKYFKTALIICGIIFSLTCCNTNAEKISKQDVKKIDSLFSKWDNNQSAGISVAIWDKGQLITRNYGMANIQKQEKITSETKFDIASMSKQFTVMSILLLKQESKLSTDDDIRKYLPELPDYGEKITIEQLMAHTSGIRDHFLLLELSNDCGTETTITNKDILQLITRQETLNFSPGTQQIYCNSGYVLLAIIIERVSGMSFPEYTKKHIFDPLEMKHSAFIDSPVYLSKNCAAGYYYSPPDSTYKLVTNNATVTGGTGMVTTAPDLVKWYFNFKNNKLGNQSQALIQELTQIPEIENYIPYKRGYGLYVDDYKNTLNYWMTGSEIGYSSVATYFPDQDFIAIILSNCSMEFDYDNRFDISNIIHPKSNADTITLVSDYTLYNQNKHIHTTNQLKQLAGKYFDFNELNLDIFRYNDSALYTFRGTELIPTGRYKFKPKGSQNTLTFEIAANNIIKLHTQQYSYGDEYWYKYPLRESYSTKQIPAYITPDNVNDIIGSYKNTGTHKAINLELSERGLIAGWEGGGTFGLQPIFGNYLFSPVRHLFINIHYDKNKKAQGFYLSYNRMRNLYFKKQYSGKP